MADPTEKKLQCVIVTPETTVLDQAVDFVAIPLYDGELGVLPGRAPLVARLGYGELRAKTGGSTSSFYIDGGFLQVRSNVVSVLTQRAVPADRIDPAGAQSALEAARQQIPTTPEGIAAKTISLARARGQVALARKAGKGPPSH
ncbi:MAG: ATP synthase F1 subunit epsilon [Planctomycetes bacterium]|nr:ATP synthase F1 subunit epsilon [Planctomycetota bacterium]